MAILVTGGAGFIGSHTCVSLLGTGYDIVVADNYSNSKPEALARVRQIAGRDFPVYEADILDADAMNRIFEENGIDAVIHFAGFKAVGESVAKPIEYYHNNVTGSLVLFDVMRRHGCKTIVFSSSATVYGMNNQPPFVEDMPLSTTNPYGSTKLFIEEILRDVCVSDPEWSAMLLRYFNPIGAHPSGLIGESPNDIPNNLFPYIASVAVGRLEKLGVFGNDYPTVDGTGVRDYIHVMDLAEGHVCALRYALSHKGAQAVNLGTGRGTSVLQLVAAFEAGSGVMVPYVIKGRRPGDIAECYADCTKARELRGWTASRTMEDMCRDGWNFIRNNPKGL